jgi:hypothetical protein
MVEGWWQNEESHSFNEEIGMCGDLGNKVVDGEWHIARGDDFVNVLQFGTRK